jgi:signal transduction histidine kinase
MAVLGEFASQVAHEIRNPLTSIKLNLQGLARDARSGQLPAPTAASVDICLLEIDRLDGVVGGVLTLAQTGPVLLTSCRVHGIVREAVRLVGAQASAQSVLIEVDLRAEADVVSGDATRLQGALLNLLLNALAAMPGGGTLRVATESTGTDVAASLLRLHVIDTGSGIRPGDQERIFRPFHTTRTGGTGLGLPIARRTVEAHGGRLTLVERPAGARGAEFLIELPLASPPADMTTESAGAREPGRDA